MTRLVNIKKLPDAEVLYMSVIMAHRCETSLGGRKVDAEVLDMSVIMAQRERNQM